MCATFTLLSTGATGVPCSECMYHVSVRHEQRTSLIVRKTTLCSWCVVALSFRLWSVFVMLYWCDDDGNDDDDGDNDHAKRQVNLVDGQMFRFDMDDEPGDSARVKLPHKEIIDTLREVGEPQF